MTLMRLRSAKRRREAILDEHQPAAEPDTENESDLERHIAALPLTLRAVVVLRQVEGYSHEEIGALLGISAGASRVRFNRAVQRLRQSMMGRP